MLSNTSILPAACRPADPSEVEPALRVLLSTNGHPASDGQVVDFLAFAGERGIDVNQAWVAVRHGQVRWTLLPVVSPGRTMLLFTPTRVGRFTDVDLDVRPLADAVSAEHARRGVDLAQMLIDPGDRSIAEMYQRCGFARLAELLYLQRTLRRVGEPAPPPAGVTVEPYSPATHAAFAQAIVCSYDASLDCPGLNGLRSVDDVIAGHQNTGDFDPNLWFLLRQGDQGVGVLLLSKTHHGGGGGGSGGAGAIELVYLGLCAPARGRGLGDWLMKLALARASRAVDGRGYLTLAVDSQNAPALKLYYRHGMQRVGARLALLRELRDARAEGISPPTASLPAPRDL